MQTTPSPTAIRWTDETIIDLIRKVRNDLIKDFLDDRFLIEYVADNFRLRDLPRVRIELIRSELKGLMISPVSAVHYEPLIRRIRETDSAAISAGNESLFYREIEAILRKHLF